RQCVAERCVCSYRVWIQSDCLLGFCQRCGQLFVFEELARFHRVAYRGGFGDFKMSIENKNRVFDYVCWLNPPELFVGVKRWPAEFKPGKISRADENCSIDCWWCVVVCSDPGCIHCW